MQPVLRSLKYLRKVLKQNVSTTSAETILSDVKPYRNIPGPKQLPLVGNTWRFIPFIGDYEIEHIDKVSVKLFKKYGKIVKVDGLLGRPDMIFLFDPDDIEQVFRKEDNLPLRPSMPSLNYYKHKLRKEFFGELGGVIAVHGENWQNFRSKVNQIMMQPRSAKMYAEPIAATAEEFLKRIELLRNENLEMSEDFLNEIHKWSLESLARIALDIRMGCLQADPPEDSQKLIDAINTFFINVPILELKVPFWKLFNTPTFKQYIEALDSIREICLKYVEKSLMTSLNVDRPENQLSVMQKVLKKEKSSRLASILALDLFLVGVDTTSNAVASILYQLAVNPEKQDILHEEIVKNSNNYTEIPYLKACIKETMRMYPVVIGNGRQTSSDTIISGYHVPKGVQLIFQHYVISNQNEYFLNSQQFMPERWLKNCPLSKNTHPFASLPFGFGKRMCLGKRFADLELQILLAKLIQRFKIEFHHPKLDYHIHPMYTPNGPLRLKFIDRS